MYGIKGINLAWFRSYLTNRIQYISITRDLETDTKNIYCGVPQGWILGPLLFLLYVNDLHNWTALDPIISADDTNLFYEHNNLKTLFSLVNQELQKTNGTGRKTIFSFSGRPEKMVFPKKLRWNMIFLVLSGKMIFLFPENMILHVRRKMKDDLS